MKNALLLLILAACSTTPPAVTPVVVDAPFASWPNQEWAKEALATVRREGLADLDLADEKLFCPNGLTERNWVHLMAAMVHYESSFNPKSVYRESFGVDSSGLFQMTKKTDNPNYGCDFIDEKDVQDPIKNIRCAGKALRKLTMRDGIVTVHSNGPNNSAPVYKAASRYWSVLRPNRKWTDPNGKPRSTGKLTEIKAKLKAWCE